jgi:hypothetical protein
MWSMVFGASLALDGMWHNRFTVRHLFYKKTEQACRRLFSLVTKNNISQASYSGISTSGGAKKRSNGIG